MITMNALECGVRMGTIASMMATPHQASRQLTLFARESCSIVANTLPLNERLQEETDAPGVLRAF
jgi:hypothetical protein